MGIDRVNYCPWPKYRRTVRSPRICLICLDFQVYGFRTKARTLTCKNKIEQAEEMKKGELEDLQ